MLLITGGGGRWAYGCWVFGGDAFIFAPEFISCKRIELIFILLFDVPIMFVIFVMFEDPGGIILANWWWLIGCP